MMFTINVTKDLSPVKELINLTFKIPIVHCSLWVFCSVYVHFWVKVCLVFAHNVVTWEKHGVCQHKQTSDFCYHAKQEKLCFFFHWTLVIASTVFFNRNQRCDTFIPKGYSNINLQAQAPTTRSTVRLRLRFHVTHFFKFSNIWSFD